MIDLIQNYIQKRIRELGITPMIDDLEVELEELAAAHGGMPIFISFSKQLEYELSEFLLHCPSVPRGLEVVMDMEGLLGQRVQMDAEISDDSLLHPLFCCIEVGIQMACDASDSDRVEFGILRDRPLPQLLGINFIGSDDLRSLVAVQGEPMDQRRRI